MGGPIVVTNGDELPPLCLNVKTYQNSVDNSQAMDTNLFLKTASKYARLTKNPFLFLPLCFVPFLMALIIFWSDHSLLCGIAIVLMAFCVTVPIILWNLYFFKMQRAFTKFQNDLQTTQSLCDSERLCSTDLICDLLDIVTELSGVMDLASIRPMVLLLKEQLLSVCTKDTTIDQDHLTLLHRMLVPLKKEKSLRFQVRARRANVRTILLAPSVQALGVLGNETSVSILMTFAELATDDTTRTASLTSLETIRNRLGAKYEQQLLRHSEPLEAETLLRPSREKIYGGESMLRPIEETPPVKENTDDN